MSTNKKAPLSRKQKIAAVSALGATLLVGGGIATSALLSDGGTTTINVNSGGIDFQLQGDSSPQSKTITLDDVNGLQPGDTFTKTIHVSNKGTLPLKYNFTAAPLTSADKALGDKIQVEVSSVGSEGAGPVNAAKSLSTMSLGGDVAINAGDTKDITLNAVWPKDGAGDNDLQNKTANTVLTFTAEQSRDSEAK